MKTEETITNFNETMVPDENACEVQRPSAKSKKSGSTWQHVAIGGVAGIAMGVAGTIAGTEAAEAAETTEQASLATVDVETSSAPVATTVTDDMSFGEAFAAARAEVGAGGVFEWHGKIYNTYYAEEWEAMSPAERDEFYASVVQPADEVPAPDATADATIGEVPVSTAVNDDMSFGEAFAAARADVGAGGVFEWHGRTYNTFYAEEWEAMSPAERDGFYAAVAGTDADDAPAATVVETVEAGDASDESDVRVIGVYEETIEGQDVYVGAMEVDGNDVMLVDVDQDGVFDVAVADFDGNGSVVESEIVDISAAGIGVDDMVARAAADSTNDILAANDMPDYVNDADVSMC